MTSFLFIGQLYYDGPQTVSPFNWIFAPNVTTVYILHSYSLIVLYKVSFTIIFPQSLLKIICG